MMETRGENAMKRSTLFSTAAVLTLSTTLALAEGAQREQRQERDQPSRAQQSEQTNPSTSRQPQTPSANQSANPSANPSANQSSQSAPSGSANQNAQSQQPSGSGNNAANQPSSQQPANQNAQREPRQAEPNNQRAQQPSQQNNTNAQREQSNQPARNNAQTNQQPAQRSTQSPAAGNQQGAQAPQSGQAGQSAQITTQQRTQIASTIRQQNVSPVRVNFAVNVGVNVPSSVRLAVLPDTIVSIVPQYRGYSYFVTDEQIVIVEPSSHRIVEVMPYEGGGRAAAAPARSERKAQFSREQRESIKKYAVQKRTATTGSGSARRVVMEDEVPAAVELDEFPETVVREVPSVRTYRYYRQDNDVIVVDPANRRVIDVID
jgi:hypothetical protein